MIALPRDELDIARAIVAIAMPSEQREQLIFATIEQVAKQVRAAQGVKIEDPHVNAIIDKHIAAMMTEMKSITGKHLPALMEGLARSYVVIFEKKELVDILTFAETDSGKKFFVLSKAVIAEPNYVSASQTLMNELTAAIPPHKEALEEDLVEYFLSKEELTEPSPS